MPLNPHFDFFTPTSEQNLIADLLEETISIYGHSVVYIPRNLGNYDSLYDTDDQSTYNTTIPVEMYIENIDGFQGAGDIYTKFGLAIKDSITLSMSKRAFDLTVKPITSKIRPEEGDLVYFTVNKKCFQISFVNNKEFFFPLGSLPAFVMDLNLFEYSDETFNTGIPEVDAIQAKFSLNAKDHEITLPDGTPITDPANNVIVPNTFDIATIDADSDNAGFNADDTSIIDFSTNNPIGSITTS